MIRVASLLVCVVLMLFQIACKSAVENSIPEPVKKDEPVESGKEIPLGWIDADTFRVMAEGPGKEGAVSRAQQMVVEKFITDRVRASGMQVDPKTSGVEIINKFGDTVKSGTTIREKGLGGGRMSVIYEVKADNLKNRVMGRAK